MRRIAIPALLAIGALGVSTAPADAAPCAKQTRAVASATKVVAKVRTTKATSPKARVLRAKRLKAAKAKHARAKKALATCKAQRRPAVAPAPKVNAPAAPGPAVPVVAAPPQPVPTAPSPAPEPKSPAEPPRQQPPAPVPVPIPVPSVTVFAGTISTIPYRPTAWIVATYDALVPSTGESYSVRITVDAVADKCWNNRVEGGIYYAATGKIVVAPDPPGWPKMARRPWCTGDARATLYHGDRKLAHEDFRFVAG